MPENNSTDQMPSQTGASNINVSVNAPNAGSPGVTNRQQQSIELGPQTLKELGQMNADTNKESDKKPLDSVPKQSSSVKESIDKLNASMANLNMIAKGILDSMKEIYPDKNEEVKTNAAAFGQGIIQAVSDKQFARAMALSYDKSILFKDIQANVTDGLSNLTSGLSYTVTTNTEESSSGSYKISEEDQQYLKEISDKLGSISQDNNATIVAALDAMKNFNEAKNENALNKETVKTGDNEQDAINEAIKNELKTSKEDTIASKNEIDKITESTKDKAENIADKTTEKKSPSEEIGLENPFMLAGILKDATIGDKKIADIIEESMEMFKDVHEDLRPLLNQKKDSEQINELETKANIDKEDNLNKNEDVKAGKETTEENTPNVEREHLIGYVKNKDELEKAKEALANEKPQETTGELYKKMERFAFKEEDSKIKTEKPKTGIVGAGRGLQYDGKSSKDAKLKVDSKIANIDKEVAMKNSGGLTKIVTQIHESLLKQLSLSAAILRVSTGAMLVPLGGVLRREMKYVSDKITTTSKNIVKAIQKKQVDAESDEIMNALPVKAPGLKFAIEAMPTQYKKALVEQAKAMDGAPTAKNPMKGMDHYYGDINKFIDKEIAKSAGIRDSIDTKRRSISGEDGSKKIVSSLNKIETILKMMLATYMKQVAKEDFNQRYGRSSGPSLLGGVFGIIGGAVGVIGGLIGKTLMAIPGLLLGVMKGAVKLLKNRFVKWLLGIILGIAAAAWVLREFPELKAKIKSFVKGIWTIIKTNVKAFWDKLDPGIKGSISSFR